MKSIRDNVQNLLSPPSLRFVNHQSDTDNLNDRINVTVRIRKPESGLRLESLKLVMGFQYALSEVVSLKMNTLGYIDAIG